MDDANAALCETIRQILSKALETEIGPDEDFFNAGGDSLAALTVIEALSELSSVPIEGWLLLDYPTARALANALAPAIPSVAV